MGGKGTCYLAPELLTSLKKRQTNPELEFQACDIFSLGMICLEMATLTNVNNCYNFKNFQVNYDTLDKVLEEVKYTHS